MRQKKAEADQLFLLYQKEKDKKRSEDAHATAETLLQQAVSYFGKIEQYLHKDKKHFISDSSNTIKIFFLFWTVSP